LLKTARKIAIHHLEPRFYGALWILGTAVTIAAVSLAIYDAGRFKDEIIFLGAVLAIIVSTIGWMWSGRMGILMTRKSNALGVLERLSSDYVSGLKVKVYQYVAEYADFQEAGCDKPRPTMPETEIEQLLSVYEQVSVAVVYGAVDHDMIRQSQSLVFKRIYLGLRHHIDKVQQLDAQYYEYFERLTCTWHPEMTRKTAVFKIPGGLFTPMQDADA
jgi:hypothetical protein